MIGPIDNMRYIDVSEGSKRASRSPDTQTDEACPPAAQTLIAVAPMMERTDRHFRYFLRLLAPDIRLYTEMLTADAVLRGDQDKLLAFHPREHPLALQLGGNEPDTLARAASIAADRGFDEINLNIGCPSDRVQSGRFGACLMMEPERVGACVAAIRAAVDLPVSVKTRIGVDEHDDFDFLKSFVETVADAGCGMFIIHARKAILGGLSPKQNLNIPPLRYPLVYRLKDRFPNLRIVINGGIRDGKAVTGHLDKVDGVMIGREAYRNPYWLTQLQVEYLNPAVGRDWAAPERAAIVEEMACYAASEQQRGTRLQHITRHLLGLYHERPGARAWRRYLTEQAGMPGSESNLLRNSLQFVSGQAA